MSTWQDVAFDQAAAAGAIARCQAALPVLDDHLAMHADGRLAAIDDWSGPYRDWFDDAFAARQAELQRLRDRIAALAAGLGAAADAAAAEQARRVADRERAPDEERVLRGPR